MRHLWDWIWELDRTRTWNFSGQPEPLSYQEVEAWARLTGRHPLPHEVEALILLDRAIRHPPKEEQE